MFAKIFTLISVLTSSSSPPACILVNDSLLQYLRVPVHQLCFGEQLDMSITHLVPIWKQTSAERTHDKGLNSKQYCEEVLGPYLLPLLRQISWIESSEVIEDGAPSHTSKFSHLYRLQHGIRRLQYLGQVAQQISISLKIFGLCSNTVSTSNGETFCKQVGSAIRQPTGRHKFYFRSIRDSSQNLYILHNPPNSIQYPNLNIMLL